MHDAILLSDAVYHNGAPKRLAKRREGGLTLIELIVTIAVLAIMLTWAVPSYQQFMARNEVAAEVMRLKTALALARNTAITRRTTITVCPSPDGISCTNDDWTAPLVVVDGEASGGSLAGDEILRQLGESPVVSVTYRADNRPVRYKQMGRPTGHNGTFDICGKYATGGQVIVSNYGRTRTTKNRSDNCM
ncbi:MAG TPA: GspH/FimT family pseudopilin [Halomonas sp.]|nr:GspH/FimT family pseudopilin [Halomonas sp.]